MTKTTPNKSKKDASYTIISMKAEFKGIRSKHGFRNQDHPPNYINMG